MTRLIEILRNATFLKWGRKNNLGRYGTFYSLYINVVLSRLGFDG